ncbi:hypothetical protein HYE32_02870 [Mycoplasmopsis bovis]|nr:hypothetical protein [Mycoplasmopsis bovis]QQH22314.1 hypothetical protein HYE32_02870 [Mycoplasmopsis bovis]
MAREEKIEVPFEIHIIEFIQALTRIVKLLKIGKNQLKMIWVYWNGRYRRVSISDMIKN